MVKYIGIAYELTFCPHLTTPLRIEAKAHELLWTIILICQLDNVLLHLATAPCRISFEIISIVFGFPSASRQIPFLFPTPPQPQDPTEVSEIRITPEKPHVNPKTLCNNKISIHRRRSTCHNQYSAFCGVSDHLKYHSSVYASCSDCLWIAFSMFFAFLPEFVRSVISNSHQPYYSGISLHEDTCSWLWRAIRSGACIRWPARRVSVLAKRHWRESSGDLDLQRDHSLPSVIL